MLYYLQVTTVISGLQEAGAVNYGNMEVAAISFMDVRGNTEVVRIHTADHE